MTLPVGIRADHACRYRSRRSRLADRSRSRPRLVIPSSGIAIDDDVRALRDARQFLDPSAADLSAQLRQTGRAGRGHRLKGAAPTAAATGEQ
jgi:hypothetical protein